LEKRSSFINPCVDVQAVDGRTEPVDVVVRTLLWVDVFGYHHTSCSALPTVGVFAGKTHLAVRAGQRRRTVLPHRARCSRATSTDDAGRYISVGEIKVHAQPRALAYLDSEPQDIPLNDVLLLGAGGSVGGGKRTWVGAVYDHGGAILQSALLRPVCGPSLRSPVNNPCCRRSTQQQRRPPRSN
jgi:hypothetical protein